MIGGTQIGNTTQDQSGYGSNGNEGVLYTPRISRTGALQPVTNIPWTLLYISKAILYWETYMFFNSLPVYPHC